MKPIKSLALLAAGALAFSACSKKAEPQKTSEVQQETSTTTTNAATDTMNTDQGSGAGAAAIGAGAAATGAAATTPHHAKHVEPATTTEEGSGAVSDEAASDDLRDEEYVDEVEEYTDQGTGAGIREEEEMEWVDETASEPNDVKGGRNPRLLHKQDQVHKTSSEPLDTQE